MNTGLQFLRLLFATIAKNMSYLLTREHAFWMLKERPVDMHQLTAIIKRVWDGHIMNKKWQKSGKVRDIRKQTFRNYFVTTPPIAPPASSSFPYLDTPPPPPCPRFSSSLAIQLVQFCHPSFLYRQI